MIIARCFVENSLKCFELENGCYSSCLTLNENFKVYHWKFETSLKCERCGFLSLLKIHQIGEI